MAQFLCDPFENALVTEPELPSSPMVVALEEFEVLAERSMSPMVHAYVSGGAADEITLRENRAGWSTIRLAPHVLSDVSKICIKTEILGQRFGMPMILAPVGLLGMCHPDGERAMVSGANAAGAGLVLSSFSN